MFSNSVVLPDTIDSSFIQQFFNDEDFSMVLRYDSQFCNTPKIRSLLKRIFKHYNLAAKDINRLILVGDELNNNAIEHGTGEWWVNTLKLTIQKNQSSIDICIEVIDSGKGSADIMKNLQKKHSQDHVRSSASIRWRWLFLITETIADELYFEDIPENWLLAGIKKNIVL